MRKLLVTLVATLMVFALSVAPAGAKTRHHPPPASCQEAIRTANALTLELTKVLTLAGNFFGELSTNARTNDTDVPLFLSTLTSSVQSFNGGIESMQADVSSRASEYHDAATRCLAGK